MCGVGPVVALGGRARVVAVDVVDAVDQTVQLVELPQTKVHVLERKWEIDFNISSQQISFNICYFQDIGSGKAYPYHRRL